MSDISNSDTPDLDNIDRNHLVTRFRYMQKLRENIRDRFRKEYLAELVNSGQKRKTDSLSVGDIVHVESDNKKRLDWPFGRILKIHEGKDGESRVARVKVSQGEIVRPFQRLYPLEVSEKEDTSQLRNSNGNRRPLGPVDDEQNSTRKEGEVENNEEGEKLTKTRYGRTVRSPARYGIL